MAHAVEEVEEMTGLSKALVLNIGTLDHALVEAMIKAGKAANRKNIPVVLDPVELVLPLFAGRPCRPCYKRFVFR